MAAAATTRADSSTPVTSFPGFDGIRLFASLSVLVSHAFLMAGRSEAADPAVWLLGKGQVLGHYGVFTFFIISGFLLARSLSRDGNAVTFTRNRVLRIVPAFVFCTAVISLVIGPFITTRPVAEYFQQVTTYKYISSSLSCFCDYWEQPFQWRAIWNNASVLNGSLWSLSYEVLSYVTLLWLWVLLRRITPIAVILVLIALAGLVSKQAYSWITGIAYTLPYFAAGVAMFVVHRRFGTHKVGAAIAALLLVAGAVFHVFSVAFCIAGTYLIIFFAERTNPGSRFARRAGDLSYGVYLFGWPIESLVLMLTKTSSGLALLLYSLLPTLAVAAISWWMVERPFMKLKGAGHTFAIPTLGLRKAATAIT